MSRQVETKQMENEAEENYADSVQLVRSVTRIFPFTQTDKIPKYISIP